MKPTLGGAKFFSSEFLREVGISSSGSVRRALNSLVAARLIQPSRTGYRFGNPFFREWLKRGVNG